MLRETALLRLAAFALAVSAGTVAAQTNTFELRAAGTKIGQATYTIARSKNGYKLTVKSDAQVGSHPSQVTDEFSYDENYAFLEGSIANRDMHLFDAYVPSKTRTELLATRSRNGAQDSSNLEIKPDLVVLPGLDPGAAQMMLFLATTHPTANGTYSILVPGGGEGGGGEEGGGGRGGRGGSRAAAPVAAAAAAPVDDGPKAGGNAADGIWKKAQKMQGTLDGKPIQVQVYQLSSGSFRWIFFADDQNNLMQVTLPTLRATYVRQNFRLELPPAPPLAPRNP